MDFQSVASEGPSTMDFQSVASEGPSTMDFQSVASEGPRPTDWKSIVRDTDGLEVHRTYKKSHFGCCRSG